MGSPILGSSFNPILWTGSACAQFREMFATNEKLNQIFSWMFNAAGELSDAVVDGIADRMTPCGAVILWASETMPSDYWAPLNGQAISRTTYAKLFARWGTTFGAGDGTTTFNLPNPNGRVIVHAGDTYDVGETFGVKDSVLDLDNVPQHFHGFGSSLPDTNDAFFTGRDWSQGVNGTTKSFKMLGDGVGLEGNPTAAITGGDLSTSLAMPNAEDPIVTTGHENRQPSLVMIYIAKIK
jgi:microcystin-dependent protein